MTMTLSRWIRLGAARLRTQADMDQGTPELIPISLWKAPGWSL